MFPCCLLSRSIVASVVKIETVHDVPGTQTTGFLDRPPVDLSLAEVASVDRVLRVSWVVELEGVDEDVPST
jgi:hypothetical protein